MAEEATLRRIMPNDYEAEQSVIGAMIMNRNAVDIASELLREEDFYNRQLGTLFTAICELGAVGSAVDPVTLQNRLREKNVPPELTSLEYIRKLVEAVPTSANVKHYAQIVADKATLRRLIRASEETADLCFQGEKPLSEILEDTEQRIFRVTQTGASRELVPIRQIVLQSLEHIEKASKTSGNVTGLATGLTDLDYNTAGLQKSDLILLAARPSMGKSALALTMAYNMAVRDDKHVAFFSLEMSAEQLVNRLLAMEGPLDSQHLRSGNLSEDEWERLVQGAGVIGSSHLIIDDTPGITVGELRSRCRKYKLEHDLDLVIIDYLQLMAGSGTRSSDNRQQEVSDISRALKALARELNIPVLALSQLSRAVESRTDHRPMLSDLRESGAIEQDADIVMFIYRDEYYNKDTDKKGITELIIAKQRNGPIGTVNLAFLPEQTRFVSAESEYHKR